MFAKFSKVEEICKNTYCTQTAKSCTDNFSSSYEASVCV